MTPTQERIEALTATDLIGVSEEELLEMQRQYREEVQRGLR